MNFKTGFIALALMGLGSIVAVGCGGSACDDLADELASCGEVEDGSAEDGAECTDEQEEIAQCYLDSGEDLCTLEGLAAAFESCG